MYFVRRRLQAADLFSGVGVGRSAFPYREKCHGAPAARLGTKGTYLICPILRRRYLPSRSLSRSRNKARLQSAERGTQTVYLKP